MSVLVCVYLVTKCAIRFSFLLLCGHGSAGKNTRPKRSGVVMIFCGSAASPIRFPSGLKTQAPAPLARHLLKNSLPFSRPDGLIGPH